MSGSFYSLDTKYNSLLALLADLNITTVNNLDEVLTEGNDAGNHNITNLLLRNNALVGGTTSVYYNATTGELGQAPSVFPTIDIDYVLQEGNDADNQSITNLSGIQLNSGGITYPDSTIQTTAFTNPYPADITINSVRVGRGLFNSVSNTVVGTGCLDNDTGSSFNSTMMGFLAGAYATSASNSTFVGYNAGITTTSGDYNTAVASGALRDNTIGAYNTAIGFFSGVRQTTGSYNTFLGAQTGLSNILNQYNRSTAIGYGAQIFADDTIFLGAAGNQGIVLYGNIYAQGGSSIYGSVGYRCKQGSGGGSYGNAFNTWWSGSSLQFWIDFSNVYSVSDYRIKENITEPQPILDRLCAVKMIEYEYKDEGIFKKGGRILGVLAHELQEAFPELESVVTGEKDDVDEKGNYKLQNLHEKHTMLYMKAIQELNAKVEAQQKQIDQLLAILAM